MALKIVKSAEHYTEAAEDEILLLERVSENLDKLKLPVGEESAVRLLDHFRHRGPHGTHVCMVFEVLGENLLKIIRRFEHRGLPLHVVKRIAKQMLQGLDLLHRECGIIHTDLKPENVLVCLEPEEIRRLAVVALERALKESTEMEQDPRSRRARGSFSEHLQRLAASREDCSQSVDRMRHLFSLTTSSHRCELAESMEGINISQRSAVQFASSSTTIIDRLNIPSSHGFDRSSRSASRARHGKVLMVGLYNNDFVSIIGEYSS